MSEFSNPFGTEIDYRKSNGIEVFMYWLKTELAEVITIRTVSEQAEYNTTFCVEPEEAKDAFEHPFARSPAFKWEVPSA